MLTIWIGVLLQFGGYMGMWAAATGRIVAPYWAMRALAACACNGQTWYETAGMVTSTRNFETERCASAAACCPPDVRQHTFTPSRMEPAPQRQGSC